MRIRTTTVPVILTGIALAGLSTAAFAYVGPGTGITAIGSVLALLAGILLAIVGFIWYPLKRLFRSWSNKRDIDSGAAKPSAENQDKSGSS